MSVIPEDNHFDTENDVSIAGEDVHSNVVPTCEISVSVKDQGIRKIQNLDAMMPREDSYSIIKLKLEEDKEEVKEEVKKGPQRQMEKLDDPSEYENLRSLTVNLHGLASNVNVMQPPKMTKSISYGPSPSKRNGYQSGRRLIIFEYHKYRFDSLL